MSETPGRGYLPPTVPAPGAHRRQWPPPIMPPYFGGQWQPKPFMMLGPSSPQSEGIDLTSTRAEHNGEPGVNGQVKDVPAVSVIAPNPLVQSDIEPKEERRQHPLEFVSTENKMPPIPYQMEYNKGLPAHPLTAVKMEVGIPAPLESKGVPAESKGTPSHPVESKVPAVVKTEPTEPPITVLPISQTPHTQLQTIIPEVVETTPSIGTAATPSVLPQPIAAVCPPTTPKEQSQLPEREQSQQCQPKLQLQQQQQQQQPNADHVESLLENMFQGEAESPMKASVIVTNASRAPVLTDDKVVAILEDKSPAEEKTAPKEQNSDEQQQPPEKESNFMEVESELEKMFAGIVEPEEESKLSSDASGNIDSKKNKKKVQTKPRQRKSSELIEKKKKFNKRAREVAECKAKRQRQARDKISKDASNDSSVVVGRTRGPYIYFEGTRETPKYVSVVNSNSARDEEERERGMDKSSSRRKHHSIVEGRVKGTGLYSSTLAGKYNSHSADITWVCIFCKLRAHCEAGLGGEPAGDLFGPYILTIPKEEVDGKCPTDKEVGAEQKKRGSGKQLSLRAAGVAEQFITNFTKKIRKSQQQMSVEYSGETEVWVHEKCAVWAPGVLLVGSHLIGLADAIALATVTKCSRCCDIGACVGCVVRNCPSRAHYGCAITSKWSLDCETFIATCPNHIKSHQMSKPPMDKKS